MDLHYGGLKKFGIKPLKGYSAKEIMNILEDYYKILVVRHPLDRLFAAYNDKLNSDADPPFRKNLGVAVHRLIGSRNLSAPVFERGRELVSKSSYGM